jgi:histone acetyltransferase MYST1
MRTKHSASGGELHDIRIRLVRQQHDPMHYQVQQISYQGDADLDALDTQFTDILVKATSRKRRRPSTAAAAASKLDDAADAGKEEEEHGDDAEDAGSELLDQHAMLPSGHDVLAYWKKDGKYHEAKIMEGKKKSAFKADENSIDLDIRKDSKEKYMSSLKAAHGNHPFVYYVHFLEFDRRMDQWIDRVDLLLEPEIATHKIPAEVLAKRGNVYREDDEHHEGHGNAHSHAELKVHEEATKIKNIHGIVMGKYEMETWYFSPFPVEYCRFNRLYFCEFCLNYFGHPIELEMHAKKCKVRHPPGTEIYRSQEHNVTISMFEVDGSKDVTYCQNLCLISKLFLDHKTLFYDTKIFLFYVLCEVYEDGYRFVAYFSKEKEPDGHTNNLACILTLPCHQRKGYGHFMMSFSYELSILEKTTGGPEKPLSDLGRVSYESFWAQTLLSLLSKRGHENDMISIDELSKQTGILVSDVLATLEQLGVLKYINSQHILEISDSLLEKYIKKPKLEASRIYVRPCQPEKIRWVPFITTSDIRKHHQH